MFPVIMEQPLVVNDEERSAAGPPTDAQSCVSKWITSSYIANFGVQYNYSNLSIALLFLSTGNKWYALEHPYVSRLSMPMCSVRPCAAPAHQVR